MTMAKMMAQKSSQCHRKQTKYDYFKAPTSKDERIIAHALRGSAARLDVISRVEQC